MFGRDLRLWLLSLEPTDAVILVRHLLLAEAGRLRLPAGAVNMPGAVYTGDGGVDGHTDLGPDPAPPFPVGRWSWQIKATTAFSVATELAKPGVQADVADGRDYIIVCTQELIGRTRTTRQRDIAREIQALGPARTGLILNIEDVERMIRLHPAVPASLGGPDPLGMSLERWAVPLDIGQFPLIDDAGRQAQIAQIREFGRADDDRFHIHVFGDSGVGKTRSVYEALRGEGVQERVAAHFTHGEEVRRAILQAAATDDARAIVVVDEVDEAEGLRTAAATARGRIRLITIGDRHSRTVQADADSVEILPLPEGTVRPLVSRIGGIDDETAGYVASLAEGYPKLAVLLARAIRATEGRGRLIELIRGRQVDGLLTEMIRDPATLRALGYLALVNRLGFDDDLEAEAKLFCDTFGLGYLGFRNEIVRETGRFVASAGRYRRVSPQALAVWLAQGLIEADPDHFVDAIGRLPEPLYGSFRQQLEELGGNATFDRVLKEVLARRADTFRSLVDLSVADAQLLNAIAYASPELAAEHIAPLVVESAREELRAFARDQRRSLVWALQHLLWFEATYERAAQALLALAVHETETWSNNATGVLTESFQVMLGGTEVPLGRRFTWLRDHALDYGEDSARIAIRAVGASLQPNEMRSGGWRGARIQPLEWRPEGAAEIHELHGQALELLVAWTRGNPDLRPAVADVLARALWILLRSGDLDAYITAIGRVDWPTAQRAALLTRIRQELAFNKGLADADRSALLALVDDLEGDRPGGRLAAVMATEIWELSPGRREQSPPTLLADLADDLAKGGAEGVVNSVASLTDSKASTTFALFRLLGERHPDLQTLADDAQLTAEARVGYVAGLGISEAASALVVLGRWQARPEDARLVPWAASVLPATPELASLAQDVVARGLAPLAELNRFRYGRWASGLPVESIRGILRPYLDGDPDPYGIEAALGILESWVEANPDSAPAVLDIGARLFTAAATTDERGILSYERNRLADRLALPARIRLAPTLTAIEASGRPDPEDVGAIAKITRDDPGYAVPAVVATVLADEPRRLLMESAHMLTVVDQAAGGNRVVDELRRATPAQRRRALRHLDFTAPHLDQVAQGLLESFPEDRELYEEAIRRFVFPGEVVRGPYSRRFQERLDQVRAIETSSDSDQVKRWASETATALEGVIPEEIRREAERD